MSYIFQLRKNSTKNVCIFQQKWKSLPKNWRKIVCSIQSFHTNHLSFQIETYHDTSRQISHLLFSNIV